MIALVKALLSNCGRVLYETHPPAPADPPAQFSKAFVALSSAICVEFHF